MHIIEERSKPNYNGASPSPQNMGTPLFTEQVSKVFASGGSSPSHAT